MVPCSYSCSSYAPISSSHPSIFFPRPSFPSLAANGSYPTPSPLTRSISGVLLDSGPLAVEGVVGRALKALRADAGSPAAGSGVAESGQRRRGARSGTEAEHCVVCIAGGGGSGEVVRGSAGSSLSECWTFARCWLRIRPGWSA